MRFFFSFAQLELLFKMSDTIQVGCMKCKRARGKKIQKTFEALMEPAFDKLQSEAAKNGIVVPDEFLEKMKKWSRKNGLLPAEVTEPPEYPQNLD